MRLGYSWLTNQYGLVVDNVVGFQVVLPNGNVVVANAQTASDLFFALKGGYNNFVSLAIADRTQAYRCLL